MGTRVIPLISHWDSGGGRHSFTHSQHFFSAPVQTVGEIRGNSDSIGVRLEGRGVERGEDNGKGEEGMWKWKVDGLYDGRMRGQDEGAKRRWRG